MSNVKKLGESIERGLEAAHPGLRKTVSRKLSLAVGAMIEGQTPNTVELANRLPLETERQDLREQWLRRLLKNPLVSSAVVMEPFARALLMQAGAHGQTILLSLDQTAVGERMAVLMVSLRVGERALPLAWTAEAGMANIGFSGQRPLLEHVCGWLPAGARVMLSADRFYPSVALFDWLHEQGWHYRLRLKNNLLVDVGHGEDCTTGALAHGVRERYFSGVRLFACGVTTNLGILHDVGHPEPWIIAMDATPTRTRVLDYGARWAIEPLFSDLKGRGFHLEHSQLQHADRLERLLLMMALAVYWCVALGQEDARNHPTPLEKKPKPKRTLPIGLLENSTAVWSLGSNAGYVA